jgi:hypothetical protein
MPLWRRQGRGHERERASPRLGWAVEARRAPVRQSLSARDVKRRFRTRVFHRNTGNSRQDVLGRSLGLSRRDVSARTASLCATATRPGREEREHYVGWDVTMRRGTGGEGPDRERRQTPATSVHLPVQGRQLAWTRGEAGLFGRPCLHACPTHSSGWPAMSTSRMTMGFAHILPPYLVLPSSTDGQRTREQPAGAETAR